MEAGLGLADAAVGAFDLIGSVAVDADGGLGWLERGVLADQPIRHGRGAARLRRSRGGRARHGAGLSRCSRPAPAPSRPGPGVTAMPDDGLFGGWAGVAVALRAWSRVAGGAGAAAAAGQVTAQIAGRIVQAQAAVHRRDLR